MKARAEGEACRRARIAQRISDSAEKTFKVSRVMDLFLNDADLSA